MSKNDFREGDKVWVDKIGEGVFNKLASDKVSCSISCNITQYEVVLKAVHHDADRNISAAIKKTIEENSVVPKRVVTKYLNLFYREGYPVWGMFDLEGDALKASDGTGCLLAYPVDVEE